MGLAHGIEPGSEFGVTIGRRCPLGRGIPDTDRSLRSRLRRLWHGVLYRALCAGDSLGLNAFEWGRRAFGIAFDTPRTRGWDGDTLPPEPGDHSGPALSWVNPVPAGKVDEHADGSAVKTIRVFRLPGNPIRDDWKTFHLIYGRN